MTSAYRKQVAKPPVVLSFVAAVKSRRPDDDGWMFDFAHIPDGVRCYAYEFTADYREWAAMTNLERGIRSRVEYDDEPAARPAIVVSHEYPPIPERGMDYRAMREGNDECGPYGWGATRFQAIADLIEQETA